MIGLDSKEIIGLLICGVKCVCGRVGHGSLRKIELYSFCYLIWDSLFIKCANISKIIIIMGDNNDQVGKH